MAAMSVLVAYELQVLEQGQWKIKSMHQDRESAVVEARRIEESLRPHETRVVEETYDEASGRSRSAVVYTTPMVKDSGSKARLQAGRVRDRGLRELKRR